VGAAVLMQHHSRLSRVFSTLPRLVSVKSLRHKTGQFICSLQSHSGRLDSETEILEKVRMNAVQMAVITTEFIKTFVPEAALGGISLHVFKSWAGGCGPRWSLGPGNPGQLGQGRDYMSQNAGLNLESVVPWREDMEIKVRPGDRVRAGESELIA